MADEKAVKGKTSKFKGKGKRITYPMTKLNVGDAVAIEFSGETHTQFIGKPSADGKFKDPKTGMTYAKDAATLLRGTDLDTGEMVDLIAPTVLLSVLKRTYPDGFAGKKLLLEASQRVGKNYLDVIVSEL